MRLLLRCRCILCGLGCFPFCIIPSWCDKYAALSSAITFHTEALDRGCLMGKRSLGGHVIGVLYSKKHFALYGDADGNFPLQHKERYSDRWKIGLGVLGKVSEYFTLDIGCRYHFLQRYGFESLHRWWEWHIGVRSDLLMAPQCYFYWDKERRQWGVELKFCYNFQLFDSDKQWISWENQWGFFKGKYPFGTFRKKYHYMYFGTSFFYKIQINDHCKIYAGPTLVYNTGGTRADKVINNATHRSHFFNLNFGLELQF